MQIIHTPAEWQAIRKAWSSELSLGFVPTMGNLHLGHQSLMQKSCSENTATAVSIFINPTQFDRPDDLEHYPKTLAADLALLQETGVDYCFLPKADLLYPEGFRYRIEEHAESLYLEGIKRPGHFTGVLTVVMMLLQIIKPHRSYFGEKDYQQYILIRDMAQAFFLDSDIIACPTVREPTGLAFSSRNNRLNPSEKKLAEQFAHLFHQNKTCAEITQELTDLGIKVDYIADHNQRRFAAVYIGSVRLIDNYPLFETGARP